MPKVTSKEAWGPWPWIIFITLAIVAMTVVGLIGREVAVWQRSSVITDAYNHCLEAAKQTPETCEQAFVMRSAKNESDAHLLAAAIGGVTGIAMAWLFTYDRWRRIVIVLAIILALLPIGNAIHEHASQLGFLQDCLIRSERSQTVDYCTENYGMSLWAVDAVFIGFMLLSVWLLIYLVVWTVRWIRRGFESRSFYE